MPINVFVVNLTLEDLILIPDPLLEVRSLLGRKEL